MVYDKQLPPKHLYHVTPKDNAPGIYRLGIHPNWRGKLQTARVYAVQADKVIWAIEHVKTRHSALQGDMAVFVIDVCHEYQGWTLYNRGIWYNTVVIHPAYHIPAADVSLTLCNFDPLTN